MHQSFQPYLCGCNNDINRGLRRSLPNNAFRDSGARGFRKPTIGDWILDPAPTYLPAMSCGRARQVTRF